MGRRTCEGVAFNARTGAGCVGLYGCVAVCGCVRLETEGEGKRQSWEANTHSDVQKRKDRKRKGKKRKEELHRLRKASPHHEKGGTLRPAGTVR
eukprot:1160937-Pelagomonas_calceolata.AAC.5